MDNLTPISKRLTKEGFQNMERQTELFAWLKNPLLTILTATTILLFGYKLYVEIPIFITLVRDFLLTNEVTLIQILIEAVIFLLNLVFPMSLVLLFVAKQKQNSETAQVGVMVARIYSILLNLYFIILYILLMLKALEFTADDFKVALLVILGVTVLFLILIIFLRNVTQFLYEIEKIFDGISETNPTPLPLRRSLFVVLLLLGGLIAIASTGYLQTAEVQTFYESTAFVEVIGDLEVDIILLSVFAFNTVILLVLVYDYIRKYYQKTVLESRSLAQKTVDFLKQTLVVLIKIKDVAIQFLLGIWKLFRWIFVLFVNLFKWIVGLFPKKEKY
ncbi:MAG: hypothetical protein JXB08_02800 [Bacilli bacterium]|nr:hypothetical protein [Bacilli bacterium]MBN2877871.1 hypothetical protein [Bacilli bacterium]